MSQLLRKGTTGSFQPVRFYVLSIGGSSLKLSMMSLPITIVDAFTSQPFAGNPAAVCLIAAEKEGKVLPNKRNHKAGLILPFYRPQPLFLLYHYLCLSRHFCFMYCCICLLLYSLPFPLLAFLFYCSICLFLSASSSICMMYYFY